MQQTKPIMYLHILLSAVWLFTSCSGGQGEDGQHRGMSFSGNRQSQTITVQINTRIPNYESIQAALSNEFGKADVEVNVQIQTVAGEAVGERFLVVVGANVPPSLLMRLKKVLRTTAAAQASFRTDEGSSPNTVYIGKAG